MSELACEFEYDEENEYDTATLSSIRDAVESMTKFNQIEVLRIIYLFKETIINENKYGIHINLTELPTQILDKLTIYVDYVKTQEIQLSQVEKQKEDYKNNYFIKDNKDKIIIKGK